MRRLSRRWSKSFALVLMLALIVPILAACGASEAPTGNQGGEGTGAGPTATTEAPAAEPTAGAEATEPAATEADATEAPATGDTSRFLVFGGSGEPDTLDSMDTTAGTALIVTRQILETLVGFKPGTTELQPLLATEWTANEDSTEWTFTLQEGVTFHDGTPFNAEAVVFNFKRGLEPDFEFGFREGDVRKSYPIFPDIFGGFKDDPNTFYENVEAVDEHTVKFTFTQPVPLFPNFVAASYFGLSSPEAVKEHGARYGTADVGAVGTGPFKFQEWRPGENVTLVRNEEYWGEPAKMPGVVVRFISDSAQRYAELQSGAVDFTINLAPDARPQIESSNNLQVVDLEPFNIAYLSFDMTVKPLDDPLVRRAIAHAIDRQAILDSFYGGIGTVADDFLPDGLAWARPDNLTTYEYDPEKARQLLAEAGYPDGFSTVALTDGTELPLELWYMPVSRPYYPTPQPVAEAYASFLAEVGINVELKTEDWAVYLDNWDVGQKHGLVMLGWTGDYADPNNFLFTHFGPGNASESGYEKQELWDLLKQAGAAPNEEEAAQLFKQAGEIINADLPRLPIVHAPPVYAAKQTLQGWVPNPVGGEPFKNIFIEK